MFLNIASFLPAEMRQSHPNLGVEIFGVILSMYNVARLIFSVPIGSTISKVGKKNYILIGFVCLIISTMGFASLHYVVHDLLYVVLAFLFRFLQGVGGTILQVVCYAIILKEYGAKKEVGLAYLSAARGLGFFGGPLSGQIFYNLFGYFYTFLIFAGLLTIAMIYSMLCLPVRLNHEAIKTAAQIRATLRLSKVQKTITYCEILKVKRAAFCLVTVIFAMMYAIFFESFLAFNLAVMGISKSYVGYFISLFAFFYTLIAFKVSAMIKRFGARTISLCSYLTIAVGCVILGPSNMIFPNNCYV
jgi:MFS family permease